MNKLIKIIMMVVMVLFLGVNINASHGDDAYSYLKVIDQKYQKRIAGSEVEKNMAGYIKNEMEGYGYNTKTEDFSFSRGGKNVDSQNIIAIKKGKSNKQIIVGAHYDSVGTNGVDDNGSGVAITLESAKKLKNVSLDYTVVFIFFGSEEVGLQGSKAYANNMDEVEINNTILMINIDSVLAGTYPYIYGGSITDNKVIDKWGVDQGIELSKELNLKLRTNNTKLNYDYLSPTTGNWSDHASFKKLGIPHIYLEASNWEVLDNINKPEEGSSGAAETEIGAVMHVPSRDNLEFINSEWPNRAQDNLSTYSKFLYNYIPRVNPNGLKKVVKPTYKKEVKGKTTIYYKLVNDKYLMYKKEVNESNKKVVYNYQTITKSTLISKQVYTYKNKKLINKEYYKYNKSKVSSYKSYKLNKNNKYINVYSSNKSYFKNNSIKDYSITKKNLNNQKTYLSLMKYKNNKKVKFIKYEYKKNKPLKRYEYNYNNGQLKTKKSTRYLTYYNKKGKAVKTYKKYYNSKGKLAKKNYYSKLKVGLK